MNNPFILNIRLLGAIEIFFDDAHVIEGFTCKKTCNSMGEKRALPVLLLILFDEGNGYTYPAFRISAAFIAINEGAESQGFPH